MSRRKYFFILRNSNDCLPGSCKTIELFFADERHFLNYIRNKNFDQVEMDGNFSCAWFMPELMRK
jgi:hypothetical protein